MSTPTTPDPADKVVAATDQPTIATSASTAAGNPDPLTGEPGAHPVGVGVGALSAGAAGAAIGSIAGPIGVVIGAAIGAVAGGLAGKEVAATNEAAVVDPVVAAEPPLILPVDAPTPITMGAVPGDGFRAVSGSAFSGDAALPVADVPATDVEDEALPAPASAATSVSGLEAPVVLESTPLAGTPMPHSGEEAVRVAAYYLYLERHASGQPGDAVSDWVKAEREMMLS